MDRLLPTRVRASLGAVLLALGLGALAGPQAAGALNVDFGEISVRNLGNFGFTSTSSVLSFDSGATDELYQLFGYVGNASGMTAVNSSAFTVATSIDSAAGQLAPNHFFSELRSRPTNGLGLGNQLTIRYDWVLNDDTSARDWDNVAWSISLTNGTAAVQALSFYTYLDLDLGGAGDFADDVAELLNGTRRIMRISDANDPNDVVQWSSSLVVPDHHQMGAFPGLLNVLNGMSSATDLADNPPLGTIFGDTNGNGSIDPGEGSDFTAALQYDLVLAPGQTIRLVQAIAEPGASVLLVCGLLGLLCFPQLARAEPPLRTTEA